MKNTYDPSKHLPDCDEDGNGCSCEREILPLQLFLAKQLPEEIEILSPDLGVTWFRKRVNQQIIDPWMWDYIVRRVEEKLSLSDKIVYCTKLQTLAPPAFAPWPTRALALQSILEA